MPCHGRQRTGKTGNKVGRPLIGLVLGPVMEEYLRRSLIVSHGDLSIFVERPISATVLACAVAVMVWSIARSFRARAIGEGRER